MATGGFSFKDLLFGTLNAFRSGDEMTVSRRRSSALQNLDRALREDTYGRHSLESVQYFQGIVIGKRQVSRAAFQKKGSVVMQLARGDTEASDTVDVESPYFIYKVYIPEIEARPRPLSGNDPVIHTYPDVYITGETEIKYGELPYGALVYVQYGDKENLLDPMIVGYDGSVAVEWGDLEDTLARNFQDGPKPTVT